MDSTSVPESRDVAEIKIGGGLPAVMVREGQVGRTVQEGLGNAICWEGLSQFPTAHEIQSSFNACIQFFPQIVPNNSLSGDGRLILLMWE